MDKIKGGEFGEKEPVLAESVTRQAAAMLAGKRRKTAKRTRKREASAAPMGRRRLPLLLRKAWFGLNQAFRRFSSRAGITPDQFTVLRTIVEHEPEQLTQCELTQKISSDPNTVTSLLKRMEANGLIQRRCDAEDRRARRIVLNEDGRRIYEQAAPLALELQKTVLTSLPEDRREVFLQDLEIIADSCQSAIRRWR